jgi:tetratricopeptide (TPR) repeat protein
MTKEPSGRYATAADLADDLGRFLRDEPVRARPAGRIERLVRRCRRKPRLAAAIAAVGLCLIAGTLILGLQWRRSQTEAAMRLAEARRREAQRIETLRSGYQTALRLAELAGTQSAAGLEGMTGRRDAVAAILRDLQGVVVQLRAEPSMWNELGTVLTHYATVALGLRRHDEALSAWREALGLYERFLDRDPQSGELLSRVAECHNGISDTERLAGRFANANSHAGEAAQHWRRSIAVFERKLTLDPGAIAVRTALGLDELHLGDLLLREKGAVPESLDRLDAARANLAAVAQAAPDDIKARLNLARCLTALSSCYAMAQRMVGARHVAEETCRAWEDLTRLQPGVDHYRETLCESLATLAMVHRAEGHSERALALCERANAIWNDLLRRDPANLKLQLGLARTEFWRAAVLDSLGRPAEVLTAYESAVDHFARPSADETSYMGGLAASYHVIGRLRNDLGQPAERALESFREALRLRKVLRDRADSGAIDYSNCGGTLQRMGETLERLGRDAEAAEAYRQAIVHQEAACARDPSSSKYRRFLDGHREHLARLERKGLAKNGAGGPAAVTVPEPGTDH